MEAQGKVLSGNLPVASLCGGTGRLGSSFVKMCIQLCHAQNFPFTTNWSEALGPSQGLLWYPYSSRSLWATRKKPGSFESVLVKSAEGIMFGFPKPGRFPARNR